MEETIFSALPLLLAVIIICSALISIVTMGIYFSWKKIDLENADLGKVENVSNRRLV